MNLLIIGIVGMCFCAADVFNYTVFAIGYNRWRKEQIRKINEVS